MDKLNLEEMLNKYTKFEYNGYVVTQLAPEGNGKNVLYYETLVRYRTYNKCSPLGDCEVFGDKADVIAYLKEKNKYKSYYERLGELKDEIKFDFVYDLYKYTMDWIDNYFGYDRANFQIKYKDGTLSKMYKSASMIIDNERIGISVDDDSIIKEINPMDTDVKALIINFKQRIRGTIKTTFPLQFRGTFRSTYDMLEARCKSSLYGLDELEGIIRSEYNKGRLSDTQCETLLKLNRGIY